MNFYDINWSMISVFVTILIALTTYFINRKIKRLSLIEIYNTNLVDTSDLDNKIKILYEEKEVNNVYLLILKLVNDGNKSIPKKDYEREVNILLNEDAEILSAEIINKTPNNITAELGSIIANKVSFKPLLLNSKQSFLIQMWVTSETTPIIANIDDRIEDVNIKHIKQNQINHEKYNLLMRTTILVAVGLMGGIIGGGVVGKLADDAVVAGGIMGGLAVLLLIIIPISIVMLLSIKKK